MTSAKLHINIAQGIIDAEGDEEFVWRVYEDFRDRLEVVPKRLSGSLIEEKVADNGFSADENPIIEDRSKKRTAKRRKISSHGAARSETEKPAGITGHKPRILNDLDTSGLQDFLGAYKLANNTDIIVAITRFLELKGMNPASIDAYFTCYRDAGIKVPVAFGQAFSDARSKKGFIEFSAPDDIRLTIRGINHIDQGGLKKVGR